MEPWPETGIRLIMVGRDFASGYNPLEKNPLAETAARKIDVLRNALTNAKLTEKNLAVCLFV